MGSRILVVEDEPAVRLLLGRYLTRIGFEAECVHSAERALDLVQAGKSYSAYVVDLTLPGMSGVELALVILERNEAAGILLMSGNPYDPEQFGNRRVAFLHKPFQPADLATALRKLTGPPG